MNYSPWPWSDSAAMPVPLLFPHWPLFISRVSSWSAAAFVKLIVCHNRSERRTAARAAEARHRNQRLSAAPSTVGEEGGSRGKGKERGRAVAPRRRHCTVCRRLYRLPFHHTRGRGPTRRGGGSEREGIKGGLVRGQIYGVVINCTHRKRSRTGGRG